MLRELSPTKINIVSFLPFMLSGYGSSQHCLHTLMYNIHTHALTCSHTHTHTLHTCCSCKWYFLSSLLCIFLKYAAYEACPSMGGMPPPPLPKGKFRISESTSVGYPHLGSQGTNQQRLLSDDYYGSQSTSSGPPDLQKE